MKEEDEDPFPKVEFNWEMLLGKPDHRCFGMTGKRQPNPLAFHFVFNLALYR